MKLRRYRARLLGVAVAGATLMGASYAWTTFSGTSFSGTSPAVASNGGDEKAGNAGPKDDRPVLLSAVAVAPDNGSGVKASPSALGKAASELGKLNAARASTTAPAPKAGQVAAYESRMRSALALEDPAQRTAAIAAARQDLAQSANRKLTGPAIARVDSLLGLPASPPNLGIGSTKKGAQGKTPTAPPSAQASAHGKAASALLNLSDVNTPAKASSLSRPSAIVGQIAAYETQMKAALAIENRPQRAAAVGAARRELGLSTNRQLTPTAITRVDQALGLPATPTDLGMTASTAQRP